MTLTLLYISVAIIILFYLLIGRRENVLSPQVMYIVGTVGFLFPGAITKTAVLWTIDEQTEWTVFWAMLFSISLVVIGSKLAAKLRKKRNLNRQTAESRLSTLALAIILLSSLIAKIYFDPDTIIAHFTDEPEKQTGILEQYLSILGALPVALACLAPWMWNNLKERRWYSKTLIVLIVFVGSFSLSRTPSFYALGTVAVHGMWRNRTVWRTPHIRLLALVVLVSIIPLLTFFAALIKGSGRLAESAQRQEKVEYYQAYEYAVERQYELSVSDAYGNLLFILDNYPSRYDYTPGLSIAVLATTVIPRSVAPWKPWSASYRVTNQLLGANTYENQGTSLVTSFLGEMWMNGGWVPILLGSFLLGVVGYWFQNLTRDDQPNSLRHSIYMMTLVMFTLIQRGDLLSTFFRGLVFIFLAVVSAKIICLFASRFRGAVRSISSGSQSQSLSASRAR